MQAAHVAVTGSTGFVGRHVVDELLRRDHRVTRIARPGAARPVRMGDNSGWVELDFTSLPDDPHAAIGSPDLLIHLAWGGLPNYASLHHFERELPQQYELLRRLVASGLKKLVVTGTCFEYGLQSGALAESMPTRPVNPYGFAKDTLRRQLEFLQAMQPFALTWARLFYLHGAGQSEQSLLPQLRRAVQRGDASFPMSGGEQLRDYLDVAEVAAGLVDLGANDRGHGVVNLCSGRPVSVRRLVEGWVQANGWHIALDLGRHPYSPHEPLAFWGDDTKLEQCLQRA